MSVYSSILVRKKKKSCARLCLHLCASQSEVGKLSAQNMFKNAHQNILLTVSEFRQGAPAMPKIRYKPTEIWTNCHSLSEICSRSNDLFDDNINKLIYTSRVQQVDGKSQINDTTTHQPIDNSNKLSKNNAVLITLNTFTVICEKKL